MLALNTIHPDMLFEPSEFGERKELRDAASIDAILNWMGLGYQASDFEYAVVLLNDSKQVVEVWAVCNNGQTAWPMFPPERQYRQVVP